MAGLPDTVHFPKQAGEIQWPRDITAAVVSETGMLTNSDLEIAAVVLQLNILEPLVAAIMHHKSVHIHSNNIPCVTW